MQTITSRYPQPGREDNRPPLVIGGRLLVDQLVSPYHHQLHHQLPPKSTLKDSLFKFKEHHNYCSTRRRSSAAFEARLEAQKTEFLANKYLETVRQDQSSNTACVGLTSSLSSTAQQHSEPSTTTTNNNNTTSTNSETITTQSSTNSNMSQTFSEIPMCSKMSSFSPSSNTAAGTDSFTSKLLPGAAHSNCTTTEEATCNVIVKTEPSLNKVSQHALSCSQQQAITKNGPALEVGMTTSRPSFGGSTVHHKLKPKTRRSSKELVRNLMLNQCTTTASSLSSNDDSGNDLALTADDIFTGKIGGTPLLKPIEENDDAIVTTPTFKSPSTTTTGGGVSSNSSKRRNATPPTCATPTTTASSLMCNLDRNGSTLRKELDAFSKVMDQVEQQEKARERRESASASTFPPPIYPMGHSPHLVSPPPPYSSYHSITQQPHPQYGIQQRRYSNPTSLYGNYPIQQDGPPFSHNVIGLENQQPHPHRLQHSTTLNQIGNLLSSPIATTLQPNSPQQLHHSFDFSSPPNLDYRHGNQMYNHTPYTASPSSLTWNCNAPPPGQHDITSPSIAGQKRALPPSQYAPPTKVTHSNMSLTSNSYYPAANHATTHHIGGQPQFHLLAHDLMK